jgi:hypothetical protein
MVKVESDMLVLDSSFTKEDAQAINHFVDIAKAQERERIINLLIDLNAIRRDALGSLVAFNTDGTEVIYLPGLENK